jgi:hypothetical protein
MGICASCLGGNRHESPEVSPESGVNFPVTMFSAHYLGMMRDAWDVCRRAQLSDLSFSSLSLHVYSKKTLIKPGMATEHSTMLIRLASRIRNT